MTALGQVVPFLPYGVFPWVTHLSCLPWVAMLTHLSADVQFQTVTFLNSGHNLFSGFNQKKCLLTMELSQALVRQCVIRDWEKPPYSVKDFLGTCCGKTRTLVSYLLSSEKSERHAAHSLGLLSVALKADSAQVPAILLFSCFPSITLGSDDSRKPC